MFAFSFFIDHSTKTTSWEDPRIKIAQQTRQAAAIHPQQQGQHRPQGQTQGHHPQGQQSQGHQQSHHYLSSSGYQQAGQNAVCMGVTLTYEGSGSL